MSLQQRFMYCPTQASYSHEDSASSYKRVQLEGGRGRYRSDLLRPSKIVDVQWVLDATGYEYVMMFHSWFQRSPQEFLIDMVIEEACMDEYRAMFMPGTFRMVSKQGDIYTISAQLEVLPNARKEEYGDWLISLISYFGEDWENYEDSLNVIVNYNLPGTMPFPPEPF